MAFWTIIVVGSIVYVYFIAHAGDAAVAIDPKLAILIGISGATGVLAAAVDNDKDKKVEAANAALKGIGDALTTLNAQIGATPVPDAQTIATLAADRAA